MKNYEFSLGWIFGMLLQLPILISVHEIDMEWFIIQILGLFVCFVIFFFSNYKIIKK